ncbi:MAG TPA: hypothetical protein VHV76_05105, partial [Mycobacteriales bacterium]|nr:hypothetical protein [Mycobacteriales bacterium]
DDIDRAAAVFATGTAHRHRGTFGICVAGTLAATTVAPLADTAYRDGRHAGATASGSADATTRTSDAASGAAESSGAGWVARILDRK